MSTFPLDLLPEGIRDAISAQSAMGDYPIEAVGPAALAVVSFATQALANVEALHTPGVSYPLSNLFMILARSGDAKSSLFSALMRGVYQWQDRQLEIYNEEVIAYQTDKKLWESEKVKAEKSGDRDSMIRLGQNAPRLPLDPRNVLSKTTTNGIFSTLERGWPSMGLFTSEGGSLLAGHSLRKDNSPAEFASAMTLLWDGAAIDRTTGEVTMRLRGRRMAGLVMVQPEVATAFLADPILKTQGLHARFLISTPPPWIPGEVDFTSTTNADRLKRLSDKLTPFATQVGALLSHKLELHGDDKRELRPVTIGWDDDAKRHLGDWYNTVALKWRREETETFFGRALEHAQRLAGALALFSNYQALTHSLDRGSSVDDTLDYWRTYQTPVIPAIDLSVAKAATALVEWFAAQLLAIDLPATDERDTRQAVHIDRILKFMGKAGEPVSVRQIARGPMQRVDASVRDGVLDAMVRDEHIEAIEVRKCAASVTIMYKIKGDIK